MKALIFAEGNGFGHASRDSIISEKFNFPIMTFGNGAQFCKMNDIDLIEIPAPYTIKKVKNRVKIVTNPGEILKLANPKTIQSIKEHFADYDYIIVDGSPLGLAISMAMKKKAIYITNDTSSLVGINGKVSKKVAASLYNQILSYPEKIVIPDFSPPLTVTSKNLNPNLPMVFSGPLVKKRKQISHKKKIIVAGRLEEELRPFLGDDALYGNTVEHLSSYYRDCEVVICHGGHTTIMEALSFGKPVIVIENSKHTERYNNALVLEEKNVGIVLEKYILTRESLHSAIEYAKTLDHSRLSLYKKQSKPNLDVFSL